MGGKSETTVTETQNHYDPVFTAALAKLANEQADMGRDRWNYYKKTFQPYEEEMVRFNRSMMPMIESLTQATITEQIADLEKNRPVKDLLRDTQMETLEGQRELETRIREEALKPEDERIDEARGLARTDMQAAFGQQEKELARQMGRFGMDPSATATQGQLRTQSMQKAASLAGAETMATRQEKGRTFALLSGANASIKGAGLAGIQSFQGGGQYSQGNYGLGNPLNQAASFYSGAQAGIGSLANRLTGTSSQQTVTTQEDPMAMAMQMAGGIGGKVAGAYTGGIMGG